MKKIVISGSAKLTEQVAYWRGYFEGRGFKILDYPGALHTSNSAQELTKLYQDFYHNLDETDTFFLMNEDKDGISGYVGASAIAELTYVVMGNLNRGRNVEISILKLPSKEQGCYDEINFWLEQGWIKIHKKGLSTALGKHDILADEPEDIEALEAKLEEPKKAGFFSREESVNILEYNKKPVKDLTPEMREYYHVLCPDFPIWLFKYIIAPEFQRLVNVTCTGGCDQTSLFKLKGINDVYHHSIGVALIVWNFTHDKKQTLAALFHDIASPAFKHCIDFMNGDSETQESTEDRTEEIIRGSKTIMRQLKKDNILAGEVTDYKLYPIADNEAPRLAADRLEYTFSNGLFTKETWDLARVKHFYNNIAVLENEDGLPELGFTDQGVCEDFVCDSLPLFAWYSGDECRALMQFIADIIKSMEAKGHISIDDLYIMSERELVDWILSCGDKNISDAFRKFQRATSIFTSSSPKKDKYCTSVKNKIRYITPLAQNDDGVFRINDISTAASKAIDDYLDTKPAKYVGFDFEFKPEE